MNKPNLFFKLTKVDEAQRTVEGIATAEALDKAGEVCDYEGTKPYYQKWSDGIKKASGGKSLGNVRAMHSNIAAGKITEIIFDDVAKAISIVAKIVDDAEWKKVLEGVYTGFSQGGEYVKRWAEKIDGVDVMKYIADPSEVSIVDNPCLGIATFSVVKANGLVEDRAFKEPAPELEQGWKAKDGSFHKTKAEAMKKNVEIDAEAAANAAIAGTQQAIDDADAALSKKEGKEETEDDKGGKEKDEPEGDDEEAKKAKAAEDEKKKAEDKEACSKAMDAIKKYEGMEVWDAATAMDALCQLQMLLGSEQWEATEGEDEAAQIAMLREAIGKVKEFIAAELAEDHAETEAEKAAKVELAKVADERVEKAEALNKSLTKALEDVNGQVAVLVKRIETLEGQPAPRKGAVFAVERGQEISHEPSGGAVETVPNLTKLRLSPEEMRKCSPLGF